MGSRNAFARYAHDLRNVTLAIRMMCELLEADSVEKGRLTKAVEQLDRIASDMEAEPGPA